MFWGNDIRVVIAESSDTPTNPFILWERERERVVKESLLYIVCAMPLRPNQTPLRLTSIHKNFYTYKLQASLSIFLYCFRGPGCWLVRLCTGRKRAQGCTPTVKNGFRTEIGAQTIPLLTFTSICLHSFSFFFLSHTTTPPTIWWNYLPEDLRAFLKENF
jgi:hypothetical protein